MADAVAAFYDRLAADYHLIFADWRRAVGRQGEVLDRLIRAEKGPPPLSVLDCACGIGTQAIGLALRGYTVHGTDVSRVALARAAREAASFGVPLSLAAADFRTLDQAIAEEFDVVIACDNALPHLLTDEDLSRAVRAMRSRLRSGGLLIASIRDYDGCVTEKPRGTPPQIFDGPDGRRVVFQVWTWSADGRTYGLDHFVIKQAGPEWNVTHGETTYRALLRDELTTILVEAGLRQVGWHAPGTTGYYQPIVTARTP